MSTQKTAEVTVIPAAAQPPSSFASQPDALLSSISLPTTQSEALPCSSTKGAGACAEGTESSGVQMIPATEKPVLLVAAYCRVSTDLEEQEGFLEAQIEHWTSFVKERE